MLWRKSHYIYVNALSPVNHAKETEMNRERARVQLRASACTVHVQIRAPPRDASLEKMSGEPSERENYARQDRIHRREVVKSSGEKRACVVQCLSRTVWFDRACIRYVLELVLLCNASIPIKA